MFLVISDDLKWCWKNLKPLYPKNVIISNYTNEPINDIALLAQGSHSILSLGTFGFWGALLCKGNITVTQSKFSFKPYWLQQSLLRINDPHIIKIDGG